MKKNQGPYGMNFICRDSPYGVHFICRDCPYGVHFNSCSIRTLSILLFFSILPTNYTGEQNKKRKDVRNISPDSALLGVTDA